MTGPASPRTRIRWGWFLACVVLGLATIAVGWLVAPASERPGYLAGVLAGVGTTLLLVGIVLLLERRIIDTAVRVVRRAAAERSAEALRAQTRDLEDRVAAVWAAATSDTIEDAKAETTRLTDEFTRRVADEAERSDREG